MCFVIRNVVLPRSIFVIFISVLAVLHFLADRDLDALCGEALAEVCALDNAGELLRRVYCKDLGEAGCKHWSLACIDRAGRDVLRIGVRG